MIRIKKLYQFMLSSFVPLLIMTFFICLFIVLMQFLWRYIDELVGKGLEISVIAELFFYAALTMVPLALPLAVLLASLMTFGNLGERFELTAIKASGVSLLKVMKPLIWLMIVISAGAFFFQNYALPVAQTKMFTLLFSVRQKSPELDIPEGVFYDQIPGYNLFVQSKDRDSGTLHSIMIYDLSEGFDNSSIILADSGRMSMTEDKTHLFLQLWQGESFENLSEASGAASSGNVPYRRESFDKKEILMKFDANFNRLDEEGMRNQYVGKDISRLRHSIDSLNQHADSVGRQYAIAVAESPYFSLPYSRHELNDTGGYVEVRNVLRNYDTQVNVDSIFQGATSGYRLTYLNGALSKARRHKQDFEFKALSVSDENRLIRRHGIELHKKFTLSIACLIFFFIGAPLGAIIRKGGIGMPLVISVLLFIFYYIIDNSGQKLARDGRWEVWTGVWLSSAILLPLGIFLTYKAMHDSAVFDRDAYVNLLRRLLGRRLTRSVAMKELVMDEVSPDDAAAMLDELSGMCRGYLADSPASQSYADYWLHGYSRSRLKQIAAAEERMVEYLTNSRDKVVIALLKEMPVLRSLWLYHPTGRHWVAMAAIMLAPVGVPLWLAGRIEQKHLRNDLQEIVHVSGRIKARIENKDTESITYEHTT